MWLTLTLSGRPREEDHGEDPIHATGEDVRRKISKDFGGHVADHVAGHVIDHVSGARGVARAPEASAPKRKKAKKRHASMIA